MHGKSAASETECATKTGIQRLSLMCKIKITFKVEESADVVFSRTWHTELCSKSQQSQPHKPLETWPHISPTINKSKQIPKTPFLKTAAKKLAKEIRTITTFSNHILISSTFRQSVLAAPERRKWKPPERNSTSQRHESVARGGTGVAQCGAWTMSRNDGTMGPAGIWRLCHLIRRSHGQALDIAFHVVSALGTRKGTGVKATQCYTDGSAYTTVTWPRLAARAGVGVVWITSNDEQWSCVTGHAETQHLAGTPSNPTTQPHNTITTSVANIENQCANSLKQPRTDRKRHQRQRKCEKNERHSKKRKQRLSKRKMIRRTMIGEQEAQGHIETHVVEHLSTFGTSIFPIKPKALLIQNA